MEKIPSIILSILVVGLIIVIGIFMVGSMGNDLFSDDLVNSSSENILTNYSETLLQTPTTSSATTPKNSWLEFDGVNDYVEVENNTQLDSLNDSQSWSFWFKYNKLQGVNQAILSTRDSGAFVYFSQTDTNNYYKIRINDGLGSNVEFSRPVGSINDWIYINVIIDGFNSSGLKIYINGVLDYTANLSSITNLINSNGLDIGKQGTTYFTGAIDEVRIYNQSLSQSQITEIYNSGRIANSSLPSENLVLWYKLNAGEGETAYDSSGNGNHGS